MRPRGYQDTADCRYNISSTPQSRLLAVVDSNLIFISLYNRLAVREKIHLQLSLPDVLSLKISWSEPHMRPPLCQSIIILALSSPSSPRFVQHLPAPISLSLALKSLS